MAQTCPADVPLPRAGRALRIHFGFVSLLRVCPDKNRWGRCYSRGWRRAREPGSAGFPAWTAITVWGHCLAVLFAFSLVCLGVPLLLLKN